MRGIHWTALALMVVAADAAVAEPPTPRNDAQLDGTRPGATPAERPLRPFAGWLAVTGCKFRVDGSFIGRVQEGSISGMAAEGTNFNWPIATDGSFSGEIVLSANAAGDRVTQRVAGRVEGGTLIVDVVFDVPGKPQHACSAVDQTLKLGG
ncbi:MAG: hypothetical protein VW644_00870 [Alphaproteobacteria bacterium]